tara:strand:+ start:98 stop:637 length:540 start_codon:yes stop_codon:yes gene_type:complete
MIKNKILILSFGVFAFVLLIFFYLLLSERNPTNVPSALIDKKAPIFETENLLTGEQFISSNEFGKELILVNFFASWCKQCRDEHKYIKLYANNKNIKLIGINYKDDHDKAIAWLEKFGNPYTSIAKDKIGRIAIDWGVYGIPETFIVNKSGVIKYRHVGPINKKIYKKINSIINKINDG